MTWTRNCIVAVLVTLGCGTKTGSRGSPAQAPSEPVAGAESLAICSSISDESTDEARLEAAATALDRGCPRIALARLGAVQAKAPAADSRRALLAAEARRQVFAASLQKDGRPDRMVDWDVPAWIWTASVRPGPTGAWSLGREVTSNQDAPMVLFDSLRSDVEPLLAADADAAFVQRSIADGRLLRVALGTAPAMGCMDTKLADNAAVFRKAMGQARWELAKTVAPASPTPTPGQLRSAGAGALWSCDFQTAGQALEQAVVAFDAEGKKAEAIDAALDLLEGTVFVSGAADDWMTAELAESDYLRVAAQEEAASAGLGPWPQRRDALSSAVGALQRDFAAESFEPRHRSRIAYFEAVAALRFGSNAAEARKRATQAYGLANDAKRADLADAARAVMMTAHALEGNVDAARQIAGALNESITERGAEGARIHLVQRMRQLGQLQLSRGLPDQGLALLDAAAPLVPEVRSVGELLAQSLMRPRWLAAIGRSEEALAGYDDALARWKTLKSGIDPKTRQLVLSMLEQQRSDIAIQLGRGDVPPGGAAAMAELQTDALQDALRRGDVAALGRWQSAAGGDEFDRMGRTFMLMSLGLCETSRSQFPAMMRQLEEMSAGAEAMLSGPPQPGTTAQRTEIRSFLVDMRVSTVFSVAGCAARLRQPAAVDTLARLGQRWGELSGVGRLTDVDRSIFAAYRAEARGDASTASDEFAKAAQLGLGRGGLDARSGVSLLQRNAPLLLRSASIGLSADPPRVNDAIRRLESAMARDLEARRAGSADALKGGASGELASSEKKIDGVRTRLRTLAGLAAHADDPGVAAGLKRQRAALQKQLDAAEAEHERKLVRVRSQDPGLYRALALGEPPSVRELQAALADDERLVYYLIEPEEAWAIVVSRSDAVAVPLPAVDARTKMPTIGPALERYALALDRRLGRTRGLELAKKPQPAAKEAIEAPSRDLYRLLIAPLERHVPEGSRVLVVSSPALQGIPLAALGWPDRPWIERNPIRMLPAARMLSAPGQRLPRNPTALVVGDPAFETSSVAETSRGAAAGVAWKRLPGTREEAERVAKLYRTRALTGKAATATAVEKAAQRAQIVHIATHGLADPARPAYSALVLSAPKSADDDGLLHAYEVERLDLKSDLVVLSACETGRGVMRGSEGVMALDRAFLVAGADAVVSSLWLVDDAATAALMVAFHGGLAKGQTADRALAGAVSQVRKRWPDPYYWAAFRVVGSGLR